MVSHLEDTPLIGLSLSPDTSLTFYSPGVHDLTDTTCNTDLLATLDGENILYKIREKVAEHADSSLSAEPLQLEVDFGRKGDKMVQVQVVIQSPTRALLSLRPLPPLKAGQESIQQRKEVQLQ